MYQCDFDGCEAAFKQSGTLSRHRRTHIKEQEVHYVDDGDINAPEDEEDAELENEDQDGAEDEGSEEEIKYGAGAPRAVQPFFSEVKLEAPQVADAQKEIGADSNDGDLLPERALRERSKPTRFRDTGLKTSSIEEEEERGGVGDNSPSGKRRKVTVVYQGVVVAN